MKSRETVGPAGWGNGSYSPAPSWAAAGPVQATKMATPLATPAKRLMTARTIHTAAPGERLRTRPLALIAVALVAVEAVLALVGATWGPLAVAALVIAPGLALLPLLPASSRASPSAALAAAPALGIAAASVALITVASVGVELSGVSVRLAVAVVVGGGLVLRLPEPALRFDRGEAAAAGGLLLALLLGVLIEQRVVGETPVPGNDWAHYVLYADQIARHGSLLIDNPYWMLGAPFREDPGVPALYGAHLLMTDAPASVLQQGIALFALAQIAAVYALGRSLWGGVAGVVGALLWAALPLGYTLLGWHGLANAAALALLAVLLLYLGEFAAGRLDVAAAVGAGLVVVGIAAAHRLTFGVAMLTTLVAVAAGLALASDRRMQLRAVAIALGAAVVMGAGVAYDLLERNSTFGGTQGHTAYLSSKIDLELLIRDLTIPFAVVGVAALLAAPLVVRDRRTTVPVLSLFVVVAALAYSWVVELPLHYTRMAYYLPLALVPLIGAAAGSVPRRALAGAVAGVLVVATAVAAWSQADDVRRFYQFADASSLRGLGHLEGDLRPREVVVTDRCWSFLGTWLLSTRTLAALDPSDIQPKAELPYARQARAVLRGSPRGRALVDRYGIRYAIVDPTCTLSNGERAEPPRIGRPVFVSRRLVVLRIPGI